jgi:hypothetical protein
MKKFLITLMALALVIAFSSLSLAANIAGTIVKIDDGKITVLGADGQKTTVAGDAKGLRIGDRVTIENGKIIKKRLLL